ncbi:hypothetical protein GJ744_004316 [Endocarpon pusillum]|uniref:Uncharacterized protein n=1 Tax=Endocarpon pusillum TaxID=364733 RepID=A0A8H7A9H8_9EURO|nr:hypothetical protein GJ744_004316 [Endocarpon pusillum]
MSAPACYATAVPAYARIAIIQQQVFNDFLRTEVQPALKLVYSPTVRSTSTAQLATPLSSFMLSGV